ncbi:MAG: hypothetical protein HRU17_21950 [Polyangiaceae bacterium]|nr:hypothetical protein [Polyangiaceae bacterium]
MSLAASSPDAPHTASSECLEDLLEPIASALLPVVSTEASFTRAAKSALVFAARYDAAVNGKLLKESLGALSLSKSYASRYGRDTGGLDFLTIVHRVFSDLAQPATLSEVRDQLPQLRRLGAYELVETAVQRGFLRRISRGALPDQFEAVPNARFVPKTEREQRVEIRESLRCFVSAAVAQLSEGAEGTPPNARLVRTEFHAPSAMDPRMVNEIVLRKLREAMSELENARPTGDTGRLVRVTSALQSQPCRNEGRSPAPEESRA